MEIMGNKEIIDLIINIVLSILVFSFFLKIGYNSIKEEQKEREEEEKKGQMFEERYKNILNTIKNKCVIGHKFCRYNQVYVNPFEIDNNNDYIKILNIKTNIYNEIWVEYDMNGSICHSVMEKFVKYILFIGYTKGIIEETESKEFKDICWNDMRSFNDLA